MRTLAISLLAEAEDLAEWNAHEESEEGQNKKAELTLSSFEQVKTNLIILASDTIHKFLWARLTLVEELVFFSSSWIMINDRPNKYAQD